MLFRSRDGKFHIAKWSAPQDVVTWRLLVSQAGTYKVSIRYAARKEWAQGRFIIAAGGQSINSLVEPTGEWYQYKTFALGSIRLAKAGEYAVTIRPAASYDHNLMYFQSLFMEPVR